MACCFQSSQQQRGGDAVVVILDEAEAKELDSDMMDFEQVLDVVVAVRRANDTVTKGRKAAVPGASTPAMEKEKGQKPQQQAVVGRERRRKESTKAQ